MLQKLQKICLFLLFVTLVVSPIQSFAQEDNNQTELIRISINDQSDTKLDVTYYVVQIFNRPSRGIFLALPKNQDGVWTDYTIKSVQKTSQPAILEFDTNISGSTNDPALINFLTKNQSQGLNFENEPFDSLSEYNQLRLRVGKPDRILPLGVFVYRIDVEFSLNSSYNYDLTLLQNWGDQTNTIEVIKDNKNLCVTPDSCNSSLTKIELFAGKSNSPIYGYIFEYLPYLLILVVISVLTYLYWKAFAKDDLDGHMIDKPEFEPPIVKPWEASYLINEGQITVRDTLLSYILWLNTNKYIKLKHKSKDKNSKMTLEILKDLPDILPIIFNKTVLEIAKSDIDTGILESRINENDGKNLDQVVSNSLSGYYSQKPIYQSYAWVGGVAFVLIILGFFGYEFIQNSFLIGDSYLNLVIFTFFSSLIPAFLILKEWAKVNKSGAKVKAHCHRYKYYIQKVETLKLDFSNNPNEGVQYYLKAVAYAASFGLLAQFGKYFAKLVPNTDEIETSNNLFDNFALASFYVPPTDTTGSDFLGGVGDAFAGGGGSW